MHRQADSFTNNWNVAARTVNSASQDIVYLESLTELDKLSVMCVDMSMYYICICMYMFSLCISLAQEVENWWALDGEKCFKALKVMEDSHTTSTSLGEKLLYIALSVPTTVLVCYEVGTHVHTRV